MTDVQARRGMPKGVGPAAGYHFYETKDAKFLLFCGIEHKFWRNFCTEVGRADPADISDEVVKTIFHQRTLAEWMNAAIRADIAMGPANQLRNLLDDPKLAAREIIVETDHPHAGPVTQVGCRRLWRGNRSRSAAPPPYLASTPTKYCLSWV
jgi:crotonobetainyl-CoA:carnitine CoA-transferase CaiB-like acyl-CoA transferase